MANIQKIIQFKWLPLKSYHCGLLSQKCHNSKLIYTKTVYDNNDHDHESETDNGDARIDTENITDAADDFTKEFFKNQIKVSNAQRWILSAGSSIASLINPRRHDMIACLGETTGISALKSIQNQMEASEEGLRILEEKPRINSNEIDLNALGMLSKNTFGYHYKKFLDDNQVTPDSRMEVRFMDDPRLAYVMTRYRECHDLIHTILGMPTNMLGEVTVKWVEALNTGLPMCYGGAVFGAIRLRPKQRQQYVKSYLPWALECGRKTKPFLPVYWEKRWEQDIDELRTELDIPKFLLFTNK